MNKKIDLKNYNIHEMEKLLENFGQKKFRAKQIFEWIHKGISSFDEMTNLSIELKQKLADNFYISKGEIVQKLESKVDETRKYLIKFEDNNIVETVLMKYKYGYSICVSSQVGCKMGCKFCASTINGLARNLECAEILEQILVVSKDIGQRISNIVIMGIGEPLDNYENIVRFIRLLNSKEGLNIGLRNITLSTCGLVPKIIDLSKESMPINLAISLHAPNDEIRRKIMPIANKYSIDELIGACKEYFTLTKRRITFEYALILGVNDSEDNAIQLGVRLRGLNCHVNLIPVNTVQESGFIKSNKDKIKKFLNILTKHGIQTTVRRELGSDINASCGQLRNKQIKK